MVTIVCQIRSFLHPVNPTFMSMRWGSISKHIPREILRNTRIRNSSELNTELHKLARVQKPFYFRFTDLALTPHKQLLDNCFPTLLALSKSKHCCYGLEMNHLLCLQVARLYRNLLQSNAVLRYKTNLPVDNNKSTCTTSIRIQDLPP